MVTKLRITGPLWSAEAEVVELADPKKTLALRSLFVDRSPREQDKLWLPGTVLALVSVKQVKIKPWQDRAPSFTWKCPAKWNTPFTLGKDQDLRSLLDGGRLALLLLRTGPAESAGLSTAACLAGEINLDVMKPAASNTVGRLYKGLGLTAPGLDIGRVALTVHGSGLSISGRVGLPWEAQDSLLSAPFFVQKDPDRPGKLKLSLEMEHMTLQERDAWLASWQKLAYCLAPNNPMLPGARAGDPPSIPQWATLEVTNPLAIPRLFWQIQTWGQPQLKFEPGEFELLLADRQPYGLQPPTSVARLSPQIEVIRESGDLLLRFGKGSADGASLAYAWERSPDAESFHAELLRLAFDPVETPRFLRQRQEVPEPEWSHDSDEIAPVDPAELWGFMPLADGWAQLPVPNLTEQIYLDARLANLPDPTQPAAGTASLLQGAVTFDNDDHSTLRPPANEQPFSVTLTGVQAANGIWTLRPGTWAWESDTWQLQGDAGSGYHIEAVELDLHEPALVIDGLLWFSTGRPTVGDALPSLDDWLTGLQTITLRTLSSGRLFPPPVIIELAPFGIEWRDGSAPAPGQGKSGSTQLQAWSWQYRAEQGTLAELIKKGVLPKNALRRHSPLIWRRHPHLPMIQALPLTQNQVPANEPSANRQLLPYALPVAQGDDAPPIPDGWAFGVQGDNGAATWPLCQHKNLTPASEWAKLEDLPWVALSLPGLVLHARAKMAPSDKTLGLGWQYRFDLPFLDEVNALAQLPKVEPGPAETTSLLPPATPPPPRPPLARGDFEAHWRRLNELAQLAAADAVEALRQRNDGQTVVQHLVEPYEWQLTPELELGQYPGSLTLAQGDRPLVLSREQALEGISGSFAETNSQLARVDGSEDVGSNPYILTAGSMAAHATVKGNGNDKKEVSFCDQRGLSRSASRLADNAHFLVTPVQFRGETAKLVSALKPVNLYLDNSRGDASTLWQFWFRDLPLHNNLFDRAKIASNQAQDVNDPAALVPEHDYLNGYEWRLGSTARPGGPLLLHNLHFYPLRLQTLQLNGQGLEQVKLEQVKIVGRLQLPHDRIEDAVELTDLSNVVVLTFKASAGETLQFSEITMDTADGTSGEWPLALSGSELTDAPRLLWTDIAKVGDTLRIRGASLRFFLFGSRWSVSLGELVIPQVPTHVSSRYLPAGTNSSKLQPLAFEHLELSLDLESAVPQHTIDVFVDVNLGRQTAAGTAFEATVQCSYSTLHQDGNWFFHCEQASLFDDLTISVSPGGLVYHNEAFQFSWSTYSAGNDLTGLQFLPGMHLSKELKEAPGFAALSFRARPTEAVPRLVLESAFLETLLFFRWGASLQSGAMGSTRGPEQVFGSSAGDLAVGYTASWQPAGAETKSGWLEDLLLNGLVEVKNLISWPEGLVAENGKKTDWRLPAIFSEGAPLNHLRHTIRVLFNQHHLPVDILKVGAGKLLFDLRDDVVWQFLAVVEHQLTLVDLGDGVSSPDVSRDHRWTTLQEVRVFTPGGFAGALREEQACREEEEDRLKRELAALQKQRDRKDFGAAAKTNDQVWHRPAEDDRKLASARIVLHIPGQRARYPKLWTVVQEWKKGSNEWRDAGGWRGEWNIPGKEVVEWSVAENDTSDHGNDQWYRWIVYESETKKGQGAAPLAITGRFQMPPSDKRREIALDISAYQQEQREIADKISSHQQALKVFDNPWGGYYDAQLHDLLTQGSQAAPNGLGPGSLIVEASAAHWINQQHMLAPQATVLQYLPTGSQSAVLSSPDDFAPSDPRQPKWLLLAMPFLGRLQAASRDGTEDALLASVQGRPSPLRMDPILYLHWQYRSPSPPAEASGRALARILAHWSNETPVDIRLSEFDTTVGRSFARLDTLSLQENWLRIHTPSRQDPATTLTSVMATLPDTPARLSRSAALQQAFNSFRRDPPSLELVWWPDSLLVHPLVASISGPDVALAGWPLTGIHLQASNLTQAVNASPVYHAAATLIPVMAGGSGDHYVSLTVSPYLGIGFKPGPQPGDTELTLWSSELLCLDRATGQLRPVASRFWEPQMFASPLDQADLGKALQSWAQQTHQRLSPDSPMAILRLREIRKKPLEEQPAGQSPEQEILITTYRFCIVTPEEDPAVRLGRRVFPLRTEIAQLHFAEGQFGGFELPAPPKPFELAPPQTTGVQPIYVSRNGKGGDEWQWGLSALRFSLAYSDGAAGFAGPTVTGPNTNLWWLALQHRVQYRSGELGLPSLFRAPAIKSLLPVLPQPRLPELDPTAQLEDSGVESLPWQPLLPGALRYWLVGARPGVMLVLRHQLLRQSLTEAPSTVMVSGSVPVQHRVPRSIPLPPNDPSHPQYALQTWASRFDAQSTVLACDHPADEAFFAPYMDVDLDVVPANRARLILQQPIRGEIKPDWDGKFTLSLQREPASSPLAGDAIEAAVVIDGTSFACKQDPERDALADDGHLTFKVADDFQGLRIQLAGLPAGSSPALLLRVPALDDAGNQGFRQTLRFPLRITHERVVPLPLEPRFLHFEDPEYNRRLASTAVQASGATTFGDRSYSVTFSADRRDYNPDSSIAWRFDWPDRNPPPGAKATLLIQRIRAEDSRPATLALKGKTEAAIGLKREGDSPEYTLLGGTLYQCSLLDFQVLAAQTTAGQPADAEARRTPILRPDDVLLLQLSIEGGSRRLGLRLAVNIVEEPVIPAPEAAYALLHWQQMGGGCQVECVRFAWSPQPSRVELVCAQDLRTGIVRRRAVFQWRDSVRPGAPSGYAVQKIAQTGSTHIPEPCPIS